MGTGFDSGIPKAPWAMPVPKPSEDSVRQGGQPQRPAEAPVPARKLEDVFSDMPLQGLRFFPMAVPEDHKKAAQLIAKTTFPKSLRALLGAWYGASGLLPVALRRNLGVAMGAWASLGNERAQMVAALHEHVPHVGSSGVGRTLYNGRTNHRRGGTVREDLASSPILPRNPLNYPINPDFLARLEKLPEPIMVVGHIPPDGDCVGSAMALARTLRALGKEAHAVVDTTLPGNLENEETQELFEMRGGRLAAKHFASAVLVDVAESTRIGEFAAAKLQRAINVVTIDHHHVLPSPQSLGLNPDGQQIFWSMEETRADAAAILISAISAHLEKRAGAPFSVEQRRDIGAAIALGVIADTHFLRRASDEAVACLKHQAQNHNVDLDVIEENLGWNLPQSVQASLLVRSDRSIQEVPGLDAPILSMALGAHDISSIMAEASKQHHEDPSLSPWDLKHYLQDVLDQSVLHPDDPAQGLAFGYLCAEEKDGVRISLRSDQDHEDLARLVAERLGGGGKPSSGGAFLANRTLAQTHATVRDCLQQVLTAS